MHVKLRIFIVIVYLFSGLISSAQSPFDKPLKDFLSDQTLRGSSIGISVCDVTTGKTLISENGRLLLAPASVLKLVTSATALEILGPGYRFETLLGYSGRIDTASRVLEGNLVVRGGGDPALGSGWFKESAEPEAFMDMWIREIKNCGFEKIAGDLVPDVSVFESHLTPGSWAWEDLGNYYGASPSALTVFDNQIRLFFDSPAEPGKPAILVRTAPDIPGITWVNELKSSIIKRDLAYIYGSPWGEKRLITGTIPAGQKEFVVKASLPEPAVFLGNYLKQELAKEGILISGDVKMADTLQNMTPFYTHFSLPLAEIAKVLNHESVNLFAEQMVLCLSPRENGTGTFDAGLDVIRTFWKKHGVRDTFFIEDGSGLSRFNAITASQVTDLLLYMHKSKNAAVFKSTLPEAGKGTLSSFRTTDFPGRTLQCKSGSMDRVRAYAGYLTCNSGREVAFAVMVNNFGTLQAEMGRKLQKLLVEMKKAF